ncbi:hypothetical protein OPKNFCMD_0993 [Methylobacterium crusticola]|uniref:Cysteine rich repeat-containing protein n=1 Tax=Methylobacterium crusticola TaxID=1697972 RepID=A0ABQ4QUC3_9HYPH|nr:hypothetical protein [Methylobacterium crusticola]GJD48276.1 hypothetical protein OPKNFCMD_0993 [Methylobacterium crusticola]
MLKLITGSCIALLAVAAASQGCAQGTDAQQSACTPDVMRLCSSAIPDAARIAACLCGQEQGLSPACRAAVGANDGKPGRRPRSGS